MRWSTATRYAVTLPERCFRVAFAVVGGTFHETAQLVLPRLVRRSHLYEATAKNALRIAVELVGGVSQPGGAAEPEALGAGRVAAKKAAGNIVELGAVAALGFSPLWLLAAAADALNGSRVYLSALEQELARAGVLAAGTQFGSVDQLIGALEGSAARTARLIDLPPLEIAELKRSVAELKSDVTSLPTAGELATLFDGLVRTASTEGRPLLEVSSAIGLAILTSARDVGRDQLLVPYRQDWAPLRAEGLRIYAKRVARPYRTAVTGHFSPDRETVTGRLPEYGRRVLRWARARVGR